MDIHHDRAIFNYCDLSQHTPKGVEKLLEAHYINTTVPNTEWVAVMTIPSIVSECLKPTDKNAGSSVDTKSLTLQEMYEMYWTKKYVLHIQRAGEL